MGYGDRDLGLLDYVINETLGVRARFSVYGRVSQRGSWGGLEGLK